MKLLERHINAFHLTEKLCICVPSNRLLQSSFYPPKCGTDFDKNSQIVKVVHSQ